MSKEPDLKSIKYKGRLYRVNHEGQVLKWGAMTDSYEMKWRPVDDEELAKKIKELEGHATYF